jgi:hypothetical protein
MPIRQVIPNKKIDVGEVTDLKLVTVAGHVNDEVPGAIAPDNLSAERQKRTELAASITSRSISTKATRAGLWRSAIILFALLLFVMWLRS